MRSASNAYFSQVLSVISLPDSDAPLQNAVNSVYENFLHCLESIDELKMYRKNPKVSTALEGFTNEAVWEEVQRKQRRQEKTT